MSQPVGGIINMNLRNNPSLTLVFARNVSWRKRILQRMKRISQRVIDITRIMVLLRLVVFVAGAVLMGLEIAGSRVLAPHFGNSVYVWLRVGEPHLGFSRGARDWLFCGRMVGRSTAIVAIAGGRLPHGELVDFRARESQLSDLRGVGGFRGGQRLGAARHVGTLVFATECGAGDGFTVRNSDRGDIDWHGRIALGRALRDIDARQHCRHACHDVCARADNWRRCNSANIGSSYASEFVDRPSDFETDQISGASRDSSFAHGRKLADSRRSSNDPAECA